MYFKNKPNHSISERLRPFNRDVKKPFTVTQFDSWKQKFSQAVPPILASQKGEGAL